MNERLDSLRIALRVLTAVVNWNWPDPRDVAALRSCAPELGLNTAPDELARTVVLRELSARRIGKAVAVRR